MPCMAFDDDESANVGWADTAPSTAAIQEHDYARKNVAHRQHHADPSASEHGVDRCQPRDLSGMEQHAQARSVAASTSHRTSQSAWAASVERGKLLIPISRRDVRAVEGARLEIDAVHAC